ncbi:nuclear transport factor 2-like isoform X2 [Macadamia integrifolia]|uniref:nuclear transport factor 2-like isoform X2 n=1 Tax=Macadamia integrifolia TaxID=60698 RepID=UPI001C502601|nr:nuclear transport factor 2-like isoform X2 [Macadamia integrifolia]
MATLLQTPVSAVQVGSYFVGQYYQILQQSPDYVHQFYTDASSILRVDGSNSEMATSVLQIHTVIMSLNFTEIEIKTVHSLNSLEGGVLVKVSGFVRTKDFNGRRKFVQTFFLAPQEKGFFVLNDIFLFLDEEQINQHPVALLAQNNFDSKVNASSPIPEPGHLEESDPFETAVEEIEVTNFVPSNHLEESDPFETAVEEAAVDENIVDETAVEEMTAAFQSAMPPVQDAPAPVAEPVGEPPKQTYASILRVARGQSASSVAPQASLNKGVAPTSEWNSAGWPNPSQSYPSSVNVPEKSGAGWSNPSQSYPSSINVSDKFGGEATDEVTAIDEEGEVRSVYVRNLPTTISSFEIEQEFKNFGRIKPEGVAIRHRKEFGVCYAFVEFEDAHGVQNAIQASPIQLAGRQVHIEERRANSSSTSRGGRRGRGRSSYQTDAPRGRFGGRSVGRGNGQDGAERDYNNRPRGNGFYQRGTRPVSRNGQNPSEPMN